MNIGPVSIDSTGFFFTYNPSIVLHHGELKLILVSTYLIFVHDKQFLLPRYKTVNSKASIPTAEDNRFKSNHPVQNIANRFCQVQVINRLGKRTHMTDDIDGSVEDCINPIVNTLELLQSCTKQSRCIMNRRVAYVLWICFILALCGSFPIFGKVTLSPQQW